MISVAVNEAFLRFVPQENIHLNEPMEKHTTFRVGGTADCLIEVENKEQLAKLVRYLNQVEIAYFILGNGSNLLVGDKGYRGVVLKTKTFMNSICISGTRMRAGAGALMSQAAAAALDRSLEGLEFAAGIPGTIGGGAVMNAGAYGGEMSQVVTAVEVMDAQGQLLELNRDTMEFGYRSSVIKSHPFIVTEVSLELRTGEAAGIQARMEEYARRRREKQPLEYPSAGSTFKRPEGHYAGELIMKAGLGGYCRGGAAVSEKHCGFVVNLGGATAADIRQVIQEVQARVKEAYHVELEPEVVMIGEF